MAISAEALANGHRYEHGIFGTLSCHQCNSENGFVNLDCQYDDDI